MESKSSKSAKPIEKPKLKSLISCPKQASMSQETSNPLDMSAGPSNPQTGRRTEPRRPAPSHSILEPLSKSQQQRFIYQLARSTDHTIKGMALVEGRLGDRWIAVVVNKYNKALKRNGLRIVASVALEGTTNSERRDMAYGRLMKKLGSTVDKMPKEMPRSEFREVSEDTKSKILYKYGKEFVK